MVSTIPTQQWRRGLLAIPNLQVIVVALVVILYLEALKLQCHLVALLQSDDPRALFVGPVVVRVVGTLQLALRGGHVATADHLVIGAKARVSQSLVTTVLQPEARASGEDGGGDAICAAQTG